MRPVIVVWCLGASACSLVIGTSTRTLGDAGEDVTVQPDAEETDASDAQTTGDVACSNAGCLAEAGVCGTQCGVTRASCVSACKTQPCKDNCVTTETACRSACAATCSACTLGAGCQDQAACADAAAM